MITFVSPIKIRLDGYEDKIDKLKNLLTYTDKTAVYEVKRFKHAVWFANKFGDEAYTEKLAELKEKQKVCLLEDTNDGLFTYSGLAELLANTFDDTVVNELEYPKSDTIPWYRVPDFNPRPYQQEAYELLLNIHHGAVSHATGLGKSYLMMMLAKELGLKTLIITPSVSIASQLHEDFVYHLGSKYVGMYGDGKKKFDKLITIGIGQSLTKIEEGSPAWEALSKIDVVIGDEAHTLPTETFSKVCVGLAKDAKYRFFLSATQMRNDGSDLLLDGLIGPIVHKMDLKEAVEKQYLAKPNFIIVKSNSNSSYFNKDVLKMLSKHLYNNPFVHEQAAKLANQAVSLLNHQVMLMVDHVEQFQYLIPHLRHRFEIAHGGVSKANKGLLDAKYHKSDPQVLVKRFNAGEYPILLGTTCIGMGTNVLPVKTIINLQAGKSEIKFQQLIGRGTRRPEGKTEFNFVDFNVENIDVLSRHLWDRVDLYRSIYDNVKFLK